MSILTLKNYGVMNGDYTILDSVTLEVAEKGILNILGPAAVGKTTLIRTLSGVNVSNPKIRGRGEAKYLGMPIGEAGYPAMAMQNAELMRSSVLENILSAVPERNELNGTQERQVACHLLEMAKLGELVDCLGLSVVDLPLEKIRHLTIARVCAADPGLVFIDTPTIGLENECTQKILDYIKAESEKRAIVIVPDDLAQARLLGGRSILLAEGRVQEDVSTEEIFLSPRSNLAKEFIEKYTCSVSMQEAKQSERDEKNSVKYSPVQIDAKKLEKGITTPGGFVLLKKGGISGIAQTGIITADVEQELQVLQKKGVTHLISLASGNGPVDADLLAKYSISPIHEPIEDVAVLTVERASFLCEEIGHLISKGDVAAIPRESSPGITGVVLALHLIWEGHTAQQAIESLREIEPGWEQSEEQMIFLEEFASDTAG